jgi:hypothetical protein
MGMTHADESQKQKGEEHETMLQMQALKTNQ